MGAKIRYMGTKKEIAPTVAEYISELQSGPCLDLFSGMCSVAESLAKIERVTWCNDIQNYAALAAKGLTTTPITTQVTTKDVKTLRGHFSRNFCALTERFEGSLAEEERALANPEDHYLYRDIMERWPHVGNDAARKKEANKLRKMPNTLPYRLATITFSHGYFGLSQSLEIDSIRYAIDRSLAQSEICAEQGDLYFLVLLQAASTLSSSPGHFAQYLRIKEHTYKRIRRLRLRSVWTEFRDHLVDLEPYGTAEWRRQNRVFNDEALDLINRLRDEGDKPAINRGELDR